MPAVPNLIGWPIGLAQATCHGESSPTFDGFILYVDDGVTIRDPIDTDFTDNKWVKTQSPAAAAVVGDQPVVVTLEVGPTWTGVRHVWP